MQKFLIALLVLLVALGAGGYAALRYATDVPGQSHQGPLPPLTAEERAIAATLKRHIGTIAAREHNIGHFAELEKVAVYLEKTLGGHGYKVGRQEYTVAGKTVRNIDAVIEPPAGVADPEVVVVGAHYDSAEDTPGANDNGSGTAVLLEMARLLKDLQGQSRKRIRFVLFVNEEPPYFMTDDMGSLRYARLLSERKERVTAMYSLETLGYYSDAPGSQNYPAPFGMMFSNVGNFVSFVGLTNSRALVHQTMQSFRSHTAFPTVGGVAPVIVSGIGWSDHWSFGQYGFQGVMVTDTAVFRYPHYHAPTDTPDKVDVERLARIAKGMERVVRDLVR
jgi:Zn-dependent M28 family amino/carboxypeptidase